MRNKDFIVFILTHGRPDSIYTLNSLRVCGFTGRVVLVLDDGDETVHEYINKYTFGNIKVFDKKAYAEAIDEFDNFEDRRAIVYARNACFDIAADLEYTYFLQLDDDYVSFDYRLVIDDKAVFKPVKNLDAVFDSVLDYYKSIPAYSIAFAQGGDFIGGIDNGRQTFRFSQRKVMNTFFCSTERRFKFFGRINEDVNVYTDFQSKGNLFLTLQNLSITQQRTQQKRGGLTDIYLQLGTYVKSFYTLMCAPSCTRISMMNANHKRLHHSIDWDVAVPKIIREEVQK